VHCPTCDKDWNWPRRRGSMLRQCRCPRCGGPVELVTKQSPRERCAQCGKLRVHLVDGVCIWCIRRHEEGADDLVLETARGLQSLRRTLEIMRAKPQPDLHVFREWQERQRELIDDVNSLPMEDPDRGPALANLLESEEVLAEIIRLAEGVTRDA
jgi:hypothetical protein